jgi:hypothetical protein
MNKIIFIIFISLIGTGLSANSQADTLIAVKPQAILSLSAHYGTIFVHSKNVENTRFSRPVGIDFTFSKIKNDSVSYSICNCILHTGYGLNYFSYDNNILGHGLTSFYFLEPNFRVSNSILWNIKGIFGISVLSNPYHSSRNPNNMSYSLPVGAYLSMSSGFNVKFLPNFMLSTNLNYLHISNGGIQDPNMGINWITGSIGINYGLDKNFDFRKKRIYSKLPFSKYKRIDVSGFYSSKIVKRGDKDRYSVLGVSALYAYQLKQLHSLTASVEWHLDYSLAEKQRRENKSRDMFFWGTALGHEFLLSRFIFSQQLGYYIQRPVGYYGNFYHRWGLNYKLRNNMQIGVNLKAHRHVAHFADVRIVYSLVRPIKKKS